MTSLTKPEVDDVLKPALAGVLRSAHAGDLPPFALTLGLFGTDFRLLMESLGDTYVHSRRIMMPCLPAHRPRLRN
jgi:hypothetical protein